jgi:hypothetical protein
MSNLDLNELVGEAARLNTKPGEGGGFLDNFVKMPDKEGAVVLRILPPARADQFKTDENPNPLKPKLYGSTRTHKLHGKSFQCPRELQGDRWMGDCPVCRMYSYLWKESDKLPKNSEEAKAIQKQARELKPTERYYYNVIVKAQTNEKTGKLEEVHDLTPKIFSCGKSVHNMIIMGIVGNEKTGEKGYGDVTDVKTGRDFKVIKILKESNDGVYPDYPGSKYLDPSPLAEPDEVPDILSKMHDLHSLRKPSSVADLEKHLKIHTGVLPDEGENDGFNPAEFQKGATVESNDPPVRTEVKRAPATKAEQPKQEPAKAETPADEGTDDSMVEADFMKELREMA